MVKKLSTALKNKAKKYKVRITKQNSKGKRVYKTPTQINKEIRNRGRINNFGDNIFNKLSKIIRKKNPFSHSNQLQKMIKKYPTITDFDSKYMLAEGHISSEHPDYWRSTRDAEAGRKTISELNKWINELHRYYEYQRTLLKKKLLKRNLGPYYQYLPYFEKS